MIILFHYVSFLLLQLFETMFKTEQIPLTNYVDHDLESTIKFDPPVYRQRYAKVFETLLDEKWRTKLTKLCDFGCAEFGLFVFIKRLNRLNHILFVDIDEDLLREHVRKVQPLTIEYLRRREEPLQISVFAGSVGDPDYHILNIDVVTAVELIEHLYPDVLEAFPYNIFSYVEPKVVILTTPNADFNILFSSDKERFRHYDHKFEWTREQFEDWASNIVTRFPDYTVSFSGIGDGPEGTESLGECSQMAVFVRKDVLDESYIVKKDPKTCFCDSKSICKGHIDASVMACSCTCPFCSPSISWGICTYYSCSKQVVCNVEKNDKDSAYNSFYKLVEEMEYPFECDSRTEEEKLLEEFIYRINTLGQVRGRFFVEERDRSEIPLTDLLYGPNVGSISETELTTLLTKNRYEIELCLIQETGQFEKCVIFKPLIESSTTSTSEESDFESDRYIGYHVNEPLSDWDEPNNDSKVISDKEDSSNEA